jgi:aryl-alcohol dehydrogenase-like predicted oxidoreductase
MRPTPPSRSVDLPPTRRIADLEVGPIGLGCMPMSNPGMLDHRDRALATIHAALDAGCTLLDTSDIYAPSGAEVGHNERLVAEALRTWDAPAADRAHVVVATKGGITRVPGPDGDVWGRDGRPAALRAAAEASLERLGADALDLYYLHRADPAVPYAEQIAGLVAVRDAGLARRIAVSNADLAQLEVALEVAGGPEDGGICAVQNERSPRFRVDDDVVARCAERGIAYLPWSPLGGATQAHEVGSRHAAFAEVAEAHGVSPQQVALAWLLGVGPQVIPIPGSTRPETVLDSLAAATLVLTAAERAALDATGPAHSSMYPDTTPKPPLR